MDVTSGAKAKSILVPGAIAGAVPFFIKYTVSSPGSYREWTAVGGGAVALVLGGLATLIAVRGKAGAIIGACVAVLALGAYDLAKGFGVFEDTGVTREVNLTHTDFAPPPAPPAIDSDDPATCPDGDTCEKLGEKLEKADPVAAFTAYWRACNKKDKHGCFNSGIDLQEGTGTKKDLGKALELFQKSCELGHGGGCANAGDFYIEGIGVEKDLARALELTQRACDIKNATGCKNLGFMYRDGLGVKKDPAKSLEHFLAACDFEPKATAAEGCDGAAVLLATAKKPDGKRARELFEKACGMSDAQCFDLGVSYEQGLGGAKPDLAKAREIYRKLCDHGKADACNNLGSMMNEGEGAPKDKKGAKELFDQACKGGSEMGCKNLKKQK